jgi:hypothetical protein
LSRSNPIETNIEGLTTYYDDLIEAWTLVRFSNEPCSLTRCWPGTGGEEASAQAFTHKETLEHGPLLEMFGEDNVKSFIDNNEKTH